MAEPTENQFLDEVLGLFALEAQEWAGQATSALTELSDEAKLCAPERAAKLYDMMLRSISNLGGSAATVELNAVEKVAFALIPLLQTMQARAGVPIPEQVAAVRQGLDRIVTTVQRIQETKSGDIPDLESLLRSLTDVKLLEATGAHSGRGGKQSRSAVILDALTEAQAQTAERGRNLAEIVLRKASGDSDDLDDQTVARVLREIEMLDEQFMEEVQRRASTIIDGVAHLKENRVEGQPPSSQREKVFREIEDLYDISRMVNSTPIMLYLQGLRSFIRIATDRPTLVPSTRYDLVEGRVALLKSLAEGWVEVGRTERASIEKILRQ
jgi:chemotaxis protein histidine kinase CheA